MSAAVASDERLTLLSLSMAMKTVATNRISLEKLEYRSCRKSNVDCVTASEIDDAVIFAFWSLTSIGSANCSLDFGRESCDFCSHSGPLHHRLDD